MIHQFNHSGIFVVLDVASGAVHSMDELAYNMCAMLKPPLESLCSQDIINEFKNKFSTEEIIEAYNELYQLYNEGLLFSEEETLPAELIKPHDTPVKALCLHVSHDCNLRCKYCFAQTGDFGTQKRSLMSSETAKKAIDFVIEKSGKRHNIEIDFFGGEPLMAWDAVIDTVEYAEKQGEINNKHFRFTITTNGILLNDEMIDYINQHMFNVVLSVDGRKDINDEMRPTVNGKGSYDIIMPKFKKLVDNRSKDKDYYIRGTYTAKNLDFTSDVMDIYNKGFDQISVEPVSAPPGCGYELNANDLPRLKEEYWRLAEKLLELDGKDEFLNFFHFNVDLEQGPCLIKRLRGCGAGLEYLAITPEGDIYPCHQFVGDERFKMGNIEDTTLDKNISQMFSGVSVYSRENCRDCWARYYCSGGCSAANSHANSDINKCDGLACEIERIRLECAIYLAVIRS